MTEQAFRVHRVHVEITLENSLDMNNLQVRRDIERICQGYKPLKTELTAAHFIDVEVIKVETEA